MTGQATQGTFASAGPAMIAARQLTRLRLTGADPPTQHAHVASDGIEFDTDGWYEVLLRVDWDPHETVGTRFAHTKIPGQEPLHSEAIAADVLAQLSGGRQLLRGNSLFGPGRNTRLILEVWHDSPGPVEVPSAELVVRDLAVPWPGGRDANTLIDR